MNTIKKQVNMTETKHLELTRSILKMIVETVSENRNREIFNKKLIGMHQRDPVQPDSTKMNIGICATCYN